MGPHPSRRRPGALLVLALVVFSALAAASPLAAAEQNSYTVTPLVSDQPGVAARTDPNLVNAWGLTASTTSPWWVSDNGTDLSTLYRGDGTPQALVVKVAGGPTGTVFNPTAGFVLPTGGKALFLFDSEDGIVRAWNGAQGTTAIVVKDRSDVGAIYKGLAIADTAAGPRLYAADFHNARIDVFNGSFGLVPGGFEDSSLPAGYAPFNVQTIGDRVFVAYAKQDEAAEDEVAGQGTGFVDAYDLAGNLLARVAQHGQLNAPWGLALAPVGFGRFGGDLLVGNFGDGQINAYEELPNGHFEHRGELRGSDNKPLTIDGLWALRFGNGANAGPTGTLFFTAGPDEESHGLFGSITAG
ncbi:MAG TPA: TIGR03118 family protein [Gaiellaceae bacterium]|nr:TIGR03118 family protein [Gaiellaceae bacterium]